MTELIYCHYIYTVVRPTGSCYSEDPSDILQLCYLDQPFCVLQHTPTPQHFLLSTPSLGTVRPLNGTLAVILVMRIYAMYNCNRKLLITLLVFLCIQLIVETIIVGTAAAKMKSQYTMTRHRNNHAEFKPSCTTPSHW